MTTLNTLAEADAQKTTKINRNFKAVAPAALFSQKESTTAALTFGYYGGIIAVDGVLTSISDGTVALTDATTNYIEATQAGVVSKNTTGFTAGSIPLYTAVTSGGAITTVTDYRTTNVSVPGRLSKSVAGGTDVTLTAAEARPRILEFTGLLTGNINVILPTEKTDRLVYNNTTGSYTLTVKTSGGSGVAVTQGKRAHLYCDGTNITVGHNDPKSMGLSYLAVTDGVTAPSTATGLALIYVDTADGSLKVKFDSGTVKTLATDP